jgi:hypothetical protein
MLRRRSARPARPAEGRLGDAPLAARAGVEAQPPRRPRRSRGPSGFAALGLTLAALLVAGSAARPQPAPEPPAAVPAVGVRASFDRLLDRRRERAQGRRVTLGENHNLPSPFLDQPPSQPWITYSPALGLVFEVDGPGTMPSEPEYYLYDGVYYVFEPRAWDDSSLQITAVPREVHQRRTLAEARRDLQRQRQIRELGAAGQEQAGMGITVTVPIRMKGALAEVFGRGATNLKVTGRENISFAGESRRVQPFIAGEQGRGQSLFPSLEMNQDLQVKLEGTIGDKVHVSVDHNSAGFGFDANKLLIYYEGYEDDIVRRVDMGGTNLSLPGSNLVSFSGGGAKGLFGIKTVMRLGGLDLTMIASKEEAEVETRTLTPTGGTPRVLPLLDNGFARDRFFFYERPDTVSVPLYATYGIDPGLLIDETRAQSFRVFVDDQNPSTELERNYRGYAVEGLPPALSDAQIDDLYLSLGDSPLLKSRRYPVDLSDTVNPMQSTNLARWRLLEAEDVRFVYFRSGTRRLVLGFFLRDGAVGDDDAVAISFQDPNAQSVGSIPSDPNDVRVRLRLVRHPNQDTDFVQYPTNLYMMRHVYVLSSTDITNLDVSIVEDRARDNADAPINLPTSSYLHMFGLDDLNEANRLTPDHKFDIANPNLVDLNEGLLLLPGVRPFSPPAEIVRQRLQSALPAGTVLADSLFGPEERLPERLYRLPSDDPDLPHRYRIDVTTTGTESEIILPNDIIEGSEVVRLDGHVLVNGKDYDIETFAGGRITLKGDALTSLTQASRLEVSYQFRPLFGGGKSTLLGASGQYDLGSAGKAASVWLYESTGGFNRNPKLGEEPTRTILGDVNANLNFRPGWMTRLVDLLPFTDTGAASSIGLAAEAAVSLPNPNTRDVAFVEDLEGADDSEEQNLSRANWNWASRPIEASGAERDTVTRVPMAFYNPFGEVKLGHLNPTLDERERDNGLVVLELGFDQGAVDSLVAQHPDLWAGILRAFPGAGIDLTRTKSIEFWLNDFVSDPAQRKGRMHIDLGDISEDFVFFQNRSGQIPDDTNPAWNREASSAIEFQPQLHDFGWNGLDEDCDQKPDNLPFGAECYLPDRQLKNGQHYLANGSEGNNSFDTEDINNNGRWDDLNSYYSIAIDLADPRFVVTDVSPQYGGNPDFPDDIRAGFKGWRKYRIDLEQIAFDSRSEIGQSPPQPSLLRRVRYLRIWFEDTPNALDPTPIWKRDLQLYGLRLTRNQWLDTGVFAADSTRIAADSTETFTVGVINNKDDLNYVIPPDAEQEDEAGIQAREQSLRIDFDGLRPGHEIVAERNLASVGRGLDFTQYGRLTYFVNYPVTAPDSVEFFFRVGTDTLNFYEIAHRVPNKANWLQLDVDLDDLTGLKFPEDYPGGIDTLKVLRAWIPSVVQVEATVADANEPDLQLHVTRRGEPSLQQVTRFYVGVRHLRPGGDLVARPVSGEVWFDNVRLEDVERSPGLAQSYSITTRFADLFDFSGGVSRRDAEFRALRERRSGGSDQTSWNARANLSDLGRLVPLAGFELPISYSYTKSETRPKFFSNSDTRNTEERKREQRTENISQNFGVSIRKRASRFWLNRLTLDRMSFSYSESRSWGRSFTQRDTSVSRSRGFKYDLSFREHKLRLFRDFGLNLVPANMNFALQHQSSARTTYRVQRRFDLGTGTTIDSLVVTPSSPQASMNVTASATMRPHPICNLRYTYNEPRNYRRAAPENERERVRMLGLDFGLPTGRTEGLTFDLTPRRFRFGYAATFSDQRTNVVRGDSALPDVHRAASNRSRGLTFDFGLHRRLTGWLLRRVAGPERPPEPRRPPAGQPGDRPPPDDSRDSEGFRPPPDAPPDEPEPEPEPEDLVSQLADTLAAPPGLGLPPGQSPGAPQPEPGPVPSDADTLRVGPPPTGPAAGPPPPAPADSAAARRRRPDPIKFLLERLNSFDAVKVELSDSRNLGYNSLADAPSGLFRYGFSRRSGFTGLDTPSAEDKRYTVALSSGLALHSNVRLSARYKRDQNVNQLRPPADQVQTVSERRTVDTTFPALDVSFTGVEKLRLFGSRLERSTLSVGLSKSSSERGNRELNPDGSLLQEGLGRSESERLGITGNWTGQWRGGMTTSMALNQTNTTNRSPGIRQEGVTRSLSGSMRFKIAPKGGLKLPLFGSRTLKSGMDVSVNASYNTDERNNFNNPNNPTAPVLEAKNSAINLGARSDYTLSRNMNGGVELGFTRNRNHKANQTIMTVRLGFNLTFVF